MELLVLPHTFPVIPTPWHGMVSILFDIVIQFEIAISLTSSFSIFPTNSGGFRTMGMLGPVFGSMHG